MWIKKHWNEPITWGGLTKFNIWCTAISLLAVFAEFGVLFFIWSGAWGKVKIWFSNIIDKLKRVKTEEDAG